MKKDVLLSTNAYTENAALNKTASHAQHKAMQVCFNNIEIGLKRVSKLVHSMSMANDPRITNAQSFDVNACVKATVQKLSKKFASNITIAFELGEIPPVCIDVYKISQLLTNLILNARESMHDDGQICVSTVHNGDFIEVSVSDNGCGIKTHLQNLIFDPCYSTKKEAKRTGLGLAIAKAIASEHGGDLQVSSTTSVGSVFTFQLPVTDIIIH